MFDDLPFFPARASTVAARVDEYYFFLIFVSGIFGAFIAGALIYFAVKYRRRSPSDRPARIYGSMALELTWTLVPFGLSMVMFGWSANIYLHMVRAPDNALPVFVVARQWMWKLQHLEGRREINELHVPIGLPVKLIMTSEDVIHSFFVPAFRIKYDVLPERYTTIWFEASRVGTYHLFCAEYCGTQHSGMIGRIIVMEQVDYQRWLAGSEGQVSMASAGETLFTELGCASCHAAGSTSRGPALVGLLGKKVQLASGETVVADETYLRESIVRPQAKVVAGYEPIMPTFEGLVSEDGLLQLVAYIKSLSGTEGTGVQPASNDGAPGETSAPHGS